MKIKLPIDMTERVFRISFMGVKNKWQIASQVKRGYSENSTFSKSFYVKRIRQRKQHVAYLVGASGADAPLANVKCPFFKY